MSPPSREEIELVRIPSRSESGRPMLISISDRGLDVVLGWARSAEAAGVSVRDGSELLDHVVEAGLADELGDEPDEIRRRAANLIALVGTAYEAAKVVRAASGTPT